MRGDKDSGYDDDERVYLGCAGRLLQAKAVTFALPAKLQAQGVADHLVIAHDPLDRKSVV